MLDSIFPFDETSIYQKHMLQGTWISKAEKHVSGFKVTEGYLWYLVPRETKGDKPTHH